MVFRFISSVSSRALSSFERLIFTNVHAGVLRFLPVKRLLRDDVLAAHVPHHRPGFRLLQNPNDLLLCKPRFIKLLF